MKCRSCGSSTNEILDLGDIKLNEYRHDDVVPDSYPLNLMVCSNCTLVQLGYTVDPHLIFTDNYGFESGVNDTVRADLEEIVNSAKDIIGVNSKTTVIDIGCNDGTLLSNYDGIPFRIGFDPVLKFKEKSSQHADAIFTDFFSALHLEPYDKADIITSISMFYDLEDPNKFCEDIFKSLSKNGIWIVQQNYLLSMLQQNAYDNIVHQHLEYYSMRSMVHLLSRHNLRIFSVEQNNINGGSFRTYICKENAAWHTDNSVVVLLDEERTFGLDKEQTYIDFGRTIKTLSEDLNVLVSTLVKGGKQVWAYGASTRGDTILQVSKLDNTLIPYAIERNPDKFGKMISSLQIPIISEDEARERMPDYMLILPWFFSQEFIKRENEYIEKGGRFIIPLPSIVMVGSGEKPDDS